MSLPVFLFLAMTTAAAFWYTIDSARRGMIAVPRWIGKGTNYYDRSIQPIRFGCSIIVYFGFALLLAAFTLSGIGDVPATEWVGGLGLLGAGASHYALRRYRRSGVKHLAEAAHQARLQLAPAEGGYRSPAVPLASSLRPALDNVVRAEQRRVALVVVLGLGSLFVGLTGWILSDPIGPWAITAAATTYVVSAFALFRWRRWRLELANAADEAAAKAVTEPLPEHS